MREVAANEKKHPKLYLWQGEADAIANSWKLEKYVIVEFKVVDNLSDYWQKKTDLCEKHLHQCLAYAKLLNLLMELDYLPPSLIVVIHKVTGNQGYFAFSLKTTLKSAKISLMSMSGSLSSPRNGRSG